MKKRVFSFVGLVTLSLMFIHVSSTVTTAQDEAKQGKDSQKPAGTADAWKQALPDIVESAPAAGDARNVAGSSDEDTPEQVERKLGELEREWMEAVKSRDAAALRRLLAADFTFIDARSTTPALGRKQYVAVAVGDWKLESYGFDKLDVRVYANRDAAVVNGWYRQQAAAAGAEWSGDFLFTDVWVKQAGVWKVVSRHLSRLPPGADKRD